MQQPKRALALLLCVLFVSVGALGCRASKKNQGAKLSPNGAACAGETALVGCGNPCGDVNNAFCNQGLYCGPDKRCVADCSASVSCDGSKICTFNGQCSDPRNTDSDAAPTVCASVRLDTRRAVPNVRILLDRSSSMNRNYADGKTRWQAAKDVLIGTEGGVAQAGQPEMNPGGVIYENQTRVRFSLTTYSQTGEGATTCPHLVRFPNGSSQPVGDAYGRIFNGFNTAGVYSGTPTRASIRALMSDVTARPAPGSDPTVLLLVTDGEPNRCDPSSDPLDDASVDQRQEVVTLVEKLRTDLDVRTYVIGIGTEVGIGHLHTVAVAGSGDSSARAYTPANPSELNAAFAGIIEAQISCLVTLDGQVDAARACEGAVTINDEATPLVCNATEGWRLTKPNEIEILGQACARLKSAPQGKVSAVFPCGVATSTTR